VFVLLGILNFFLIILFAM